MRKSKWVFMGAMAAGVLALSACTGTKSGQTASTAAPAESGGEPVRISVMHYFTKEEADAGDQTRVGPRDTVIEFMEQNKDISLEITEVQHDDYQTKLQALASANDLPDVFLVKGSWISNFYESGLLADITSYVDACEWKDQYRDGLFDGITIDGKYYGAPSQFSATTIVYYNRELWKEAGYDKFPETWEEVIEAKEKFDAMGVDTVALGNVGKWQYNSSWASALADHITGSEWTEAIISQDGSAAFTDEGFLRFLEVTKEIGQSGILNKDYQSIDNQAAADLFLNGKAAATIDGYWNVAYMASAASDPSFFEKVELAPVPTTATKAQGSADSIAVGCGWFICVNGKLEGEKLEAASRLALYLSGPALSQRNSDAGLISTCKTKAANPEALDALSVKYLNFVDKNTSFCNIYDARINASVIETMNDQFIELLAGVAAPEDAAEAIQQEYLSVSK